MERPQGLVNISDILMYLEQDRFLSLTEAAAYLSMGPKKLRSILPAALRFRVSGKKIWVKKSEIDLLMEGFRERPQKDLKRLADEAVESVLGK